MSAHGFPFASAQAFGIQSPHGFRGGAFASVFAIDPGNKVLWAYDTGGIAYGVCVDSTGLIYVGTPNGFVVLNSAGVLQYKVVLTNTLITGLCVDGSNNLYVSSSSGISPVKYLAKYAFGATTPLWSLAVFSDTLAFDGTNLITTSFNNNEVFKRRPSDGSSIWAGFGGGVSVSLDSANNPVVCWISTGFGNTRAIKFDGATGAVVKTYGPGAASGPYAGGVVNPFAGDQVYTTDIHGGILYDSGGTLLRTDTTFADAENCAMAQDMNYWVCRSGGASICKVNAATGAVPWKWPMSPAFKNVDGGNFTANGPGNIVYLTHSRVTGWPVAA